MLVAYIAWCPPTYHWKRECSTSGHRCRECCRSDLEKCGSNTRAGLRNCDICCAGDLDGFCLSDHDRAKSDGIGTASQWRTQGLPASTSSHYKGAVPSDIDFSIPEYGTLIFVDSIGGKRVGEGDGCQDAVGRNSIPCSKAPGAIGYPNNSSPGSTVETGDNGY